MHIRLNRADLLEQLNGVFHRVRNHFLDWPDRGDQWQMPPVGYDGSQILRDDCDGFCLACRTLLRRRHIPSRLVYCEINGYGHLVVEVEGWILDNRQREVVANTVLRAQQHYRFLRISGFQPGDPWKQIIDD